MDSLNALGASLADSFKAPTSTAPRIRYGTVAAVNSGGTLDVTLAGTTLKGLRALDGAMSLSKGDRVVMLVDGQLVTCLGGVAEAASDGFLKKSGDTMTGNLIFDMSGNVNRSIRLKNSNTGDSRDVISFYPGTDNNGDAVVIGAGGMTVIGSGESPQTEYNGLIAAGAIMPGTEELWLTSDSWIVFRAKDQNGYATGSYAYIAQRAQGEILPWQQIYPVGAVYISYVSTSPASLFGGSWTQITDRFLRMANDVDTGGADTHTLTVAQMPSHSHTSNGSILFDKGSWSTTHSGTVPTPAGSSVSTPFNDASKTFSSTGGGGAHNNMPAYQDLYAWRRTA